MTRSQTSYRYNFLLFVFANADQLAKYEILVNFVVVLKDQLLALNAEGTTVSFKSIKYYVTPFSLPPCVPHTRWRTLSLTRQAEWLPLIGAVLLPPQSSVTVQAAEVMKVPVLLLSTCVLTTQDQLRGRENSIQPRCELWSEAFGGNG